MTDERGFTLIELLVALVAGSLLLAALSWVVGSLGREARRPPHDGVAALTTLQPILTGLLESASPPDKDGGFEGSDDHLTAIVPPPQVLGPIGPVTLELAVVRTSKGQGLSFALAPVDARVVLPTVVAAPHLVADGFEKIAFDYIRDDATPPRLPRLVVIAFTDTGHITRTIAIEPRITADGRCRFDPISLACRP